MNTGYKGILGILMTCLLCLITQVGTTGETIRLTSGEWPPYFSEHLPYYGIGSRIVTDAFALEGIQVEYRFFPWKRALILAQDGYYDGAVGWQTNAERERDFYASQTVWEAPWVFFHRNDIAFDWQSLNDLASFKVGGTLEYMYTPEFLEAERTGNIIVDRSAHDKFSWKKLEAGRIDIFPQILDVGYFQIQKLFDPDTAQSITHHPKSFGIHAEQLLLSKKIERSTRLLEMFNRGLQRLKESGAYDQYFEELRGESPK